jgi:hypothetical protein
MPSAFLKSRINAFETLAAATPQKQPQQLPRSPSPSPPHLGRKTSLIDLRDWVVDDGPFSPSSLSNGKQSSTLDSGHSPINNKNHVSKSSSPAGILINVDDHPSKPTPAAPPLPPRKTSYTSLKSVSSPSNSPKNTSNSPPHGPKHSDTLTVQHTYPPSAITDNSRKAGHAPASSISSFHSVSLSSDGGTTDASTSGSVSNFIATFPMDREGSEADAASLDESFENVSASSIVSATTAGNQVSNWLYQTPKRDPPRLPQRPPVNRSPATSPTPRPRPPSSSSSSSSVHRAPPPPPSRIHSRPLSTRTSITSNTASDQSSILSTATTATSQTSNSSSTQLPPPIKLPIAKRPTPVPPSARSRYETVFEANVLNYRKQVATAKPARLSPSAAKKTRQAAGWRGLSVDLITNPMENFLNPNGNGDTVKSSSAKEVDGVVGPGDKLDGCVVRLIWNASKLDRAKLRDIW